MIFCCVYKEAPFFNKLKQVVTVLYRDVSGPCSLNLVAITSIDSAITLRAITGAAGNDLADG